MMITGELKKEGGHFVALVEALAVSSHGRSRAAALAALAEDIRELAAMHGYVAGFRVDVTDDGEETLYVRATDPLRLFALMLRRQRDLHDLSLADVAQLMGARSRGTYAQYEQGRREPSISTVAALLEAVAPELELAVVPRTARVLPRWDEELAPEVRDALDRLLDEPTPERAEVLRAVRRPVGRKATRSSGR